MISPSNLKESLAGWSILGWRLFPFIPLNISCHFFLACGVSLEKSADSLMGVPLYVICCFSLVAFNILSLSLTFASLITMCLSVFLLGFILPGTLCFPYLSDYFLSHVKEVFSNYPFKYFLRFFLSLFSLWDPYIVSVVLLNVVTKLFRVSSFFSYFFLYSVLQH